MQSTLTAQWHTPPADFASPANIDSPPDGSDLLHNLGNVLSDIGEPEATRCLRCTLLIRLAVMLHRSHDPQPLPKLMLRATPRGFSVEVARSWLAQHPLTRSDLDAETEHLADLGVVLEVIEN